MAVNLNITSSSSSVVGDREGTIQFCFCFLFRLCFTKQQEKEALLSVYNRLRQRYRSPGSAASRSRIGYFLFFPLSLFGLNSTRSLWRKQVNAPARSIERFLCLFLPRVLYGP